MRFMFGYDTVTIARRLTKKGNRGSQGKPQHPGLPSNQTGPFSTPASHGNSVQMQSAIFLLFLPSPTVTIILAYNSGSSPSGTRNMYTSLLIVSILAT